LYFAVTIGKFGVTVAVGVDVAGGIVGDGGTGVSDGVGVTAARVASA
jgi:hypothetical protein